MRKLLLPPVLSGPSESWSFESFAIETPDSARSAYPGLSRRCVDRLILWSPLGLGCVV